jgi:hypothetical protein
MYLFIGVGERRWSIERGAWILHMLLKTLFISIRAERLGA